MRTSAKIRSQSMTVIFRVWSSERRADSSKHLAKDWFELVRNVVVFVIDLLLSNLHLQVWVPLTVQESGRGGGSEGGKGENITPQHKHNLLFQSRWDRYCY